MGDFDYADGYDCGSSEGYQDGFDDALTKIILLLASFDINYDTKKELLLKIAKLEKY